MRRPIVIARKTFSAFHLALSAFFVLSLFGSPAYGQRKDKNETIQHPDGLVQDWSDRHAVYPRIGPLQNLLAVQNNPRAIHSWQAAARANWHRTKNPKAHNGSQTGFHRDWSISLGGGTTAPAMYPAKFGFDTNAVISLANCTTDFIVYPVNAVGGGIVTGGTQPNIVGLNNLYRGPASGLCNITPTGTDNGVAATAMWSYDIHAAGGVVATSPALSMDGTKIAFVETKSSGPAHFHVLAWGTGITNGVDGTNLQNVLLPKTINSALTGIVTSAPVAGSGTVTDLPLTDLVLGTTSDDTLSSPFIEYGQDTAYVGNDTGILFRIKDVFCTFPQCTGAGSPAPSLDTAWGINGTGAVDTGCGGKLTGPVVDGQTGNVFVGCSNGKLYGFTSAGAQLTIPSLTVGTGATFGGIVDPPIVDGTNGFLYVVTMSGSSTLGVTAGTPVVVQAKTDLSSPVAATLGSGASFNLHAPTLNNSYYSGSGTPLLYEVAGDTGASGITLYGVGFNGSLVMNSGAPGNADAFPVGAAFEISPLTEFLTGTTDRLFESALGNFTGNLASFPINSFPPGTPPVINATEGCGTTGIVVDNVSASLQANSVYFGVLGTSGSCDSAGSPNPNSAVKLTQSALQ
jgi:hypothetical protein